MALTEGDKAICADIARQIITDVLKSHIDSCPHGKRILFFLGVCIGSGAAGGAIGALIVKTFMGIG